MKERWSKLVSELNLSVRTHNLLLRAASIPETAEKVLLVTNLDEMKIFVKSNSVLGMGVKARDEILDAIDTAVEKQKKESANEWHNIDELPPLGVPLVVKTYDSTTETESVKYPVYLCKSPYDLKEEWYFFPACEGICKLLPEYSNVTAWKFISLSPIK